MEPQFILNPPSNTEMETAHLLLWDNRVPRIQNVRCLSEDAIRDHTRHLREKFECENIWTVLCRMAALNIITREQLIDALPAHWRKYILP